MELLYIWIEKYRNIEKQGFNFHPNYRFRYSEKEGLLKLKKETNVPEDFFPNYISNVTAIVGKNGAGKSSLLFLISELFCSKKRDLRKGVYVFRDNGELMVYHHHDLTVRGDLAENKIEIGSDEVDANVGLLDDQSISCVFHSSDFYGDGNPGVVRLSENFHDISTHTTALEIAKQLDSDRNLSVSKDRLFKGLEEDNAHLLKDNRAEYLIGTSFRMNEVNTQINFFSSAKEGGFIDFKLPEFLVLSFNSKFNLDFTLSNNRNEDRIAEEGLNILEQLEERLNVTGAYNQFICRLFFAVLNSQMARYGRLNTLIHSYKIALEEESLSYSKLFKFPVFPKDSQEKLLNFIRWMKEKFHDFEEEDSFLIPQEETAIIAELNRKFQALNVLYFNPFLYDWRFVEDNKLVALSSGQKAMLSLYGRMFKLRDFTILTNSVIILLDEPITSYHPEWQREFLWRFMKMAPLALGGVSNVQIIIATHSPFLISDLPKDNCIFLDTDVKGNCYVADSISDIKQTFGSNIHTLLSSNFFMQKGLMGEFAKKKINGTIKWLNDQENQTDSLDSTEELIRLIGEPILKRQLQKMIDSRRLKEIDTLKNQMKIIQLRINELEGGDND